MTQSESRGLLRDSALEAEAEALYSPALPYHNFAHIQATLAAAERILESCVAEGIGVRREVVYYALLFHDAGYHESHAALGFATKEAYSAHLARRSLGARGVAPEIIGAVERGILATERVASCDCPEEAVIRMADLAGIGADYSVFLANTVALWDEMAVLYGQRSAWPDWCAKTHEILSGYLKDRIELTREFKPDEVAGFFARARANLERLRKESVPAG